MTISSEKELEILREGGRKLAAILEQVKNSIKPGLETKKLDFLSEKLIRECGGEPSFKGYKTHRDAIPYPASICISINDEVVHGIPSERKIKQGDIIGLDIGMKYEGLFTDMAQSVVCENPDPIAGRLISVTKNALDLAISKVKTGVFVGDIGFAIQNFVQKDGFGVVRELVGHGVGHAVHEDPEIPNWGRPGGGIKLKENMVIAIEPMVTEGGFAVRLDKDGWTWKTKDGLRSAHFEHTIVVRNDGAEILTLV